MTTSPRLQPTDPPFGPEVDFGLGAGDVLGANFLGRTGLKILPQPRRAGGRVEVECL